jgi:hypothetical protein
MAEANTDFVAGRKKKERKNRNEVGKGGKRLLNLTPEDRYV